MAPNSNIERRLLAAISAKKLRRGSGVVAAGFTGVSAGRSVAVRVPARGMPAGAAVFASCASTAPHRLQINSPERFSYPQWGQGTPAEGMVAQTYRSETLTGAFSVSGMWKNSSALNWNMPAMKLEGNIWMALL